VGVVAPGEREKNNIIIVKEMFIKRNNFP